MCGIRDWRGKTYTRWGSEDKDAGDRERDGEEAGQGRGDGTVADNSLLEKKETVTIKTDGSW